MQAIEFERQTMKAVFKMPPVQATTFGDVVVINIGETAWTLPSVDVTVMVDQLQDQRYRLLQPITLKVSLAGDLVIVNDTLWDQYGAGETLKEAVLEFENMLIEYLEELESSKEILSQYLFSTLESLHHFIVHN